ncbi:Protein FAM192A [Termitomyces sp. J132]|nr:Protein FAM192A [Termitomyces sp. J132]
MDDSSVIPSLSAGVVGSRFVTETELDTAKARREEQWKAAYARLGQEPPPRQQDDSYDGRICTTLIFLKIAKQEEWEEKTKLGKQSNQFRALEEDEIMFLDSVRERQEAEERLRKEQDGEEVKNFREAIAARTSASNNPPPLIEASASELKSKAPAVMSTIKKDAKKSLKGVVVKRKLKPTTDKTKPAPSPGTSSVDDTGPPDPKRQKTSAP